MVRPVRLPLLSQEGTQLLVDFYLNHRFQNPRLPNDFHSGTDAKSTDNPKYP